MFKRLFGRGQDAPRTEEEAREVTPISEKLLIPEVSGLSPAPNAGTRTLVIVHQIAWNTPLMRLQATPMSA